MAPVEPDSGYLGLESLIRGRLIVYSPTTLNPSIELELIFLFAEESNVALLPWSI